MTAFGCRHSLLVAGLLCAGGARAETTLTGQLVCALASEQARNWEPSAGNRTGSESLARLVAFIQQPGALRELEANGVLRVDADLSRLSEGEPIGLRDAASQLGLVWKHGTASSLGVRVFPFDTDFLRVGYWYGLTWGGTRADRGESVFVARRGGAPGVAVDWSTSRVSLGLALKWTKVEVPGGDERRWGALSSASLELATQLRLEGGLGFFQRARRGFVEGASLRLVWHTGPKEPELSPEPWRPPSFRDQLVGFSAPETRGAAVAFEGVLLAVRQGRLERPGNWVLSPAPAAAVYGSLRGTRVAMHALLSWRSLAFVLRNDERVSGGEALPIDAAQLPELAGWLGTSFALGVGVPVPGVELGLELPAALQTLSSTSGHVQTHVVGGPAGLETLPAGGSRSPRFAGRIALRWGTSSSLSLLLAVDHRRDLGRLPSRPASLGWVTGASWRF
jgi:hypothetical protein